MNNLQEAYLNAETAYTTAYEGYIKALNKWDWTFDLDDSAFDYVSEVIEMITENLETQFNLFQLSHDWRAAERALLAWAKVYALENTTYADKADVRDLFKKAEDDIVCKRKVIALAIKL